MKSLEEYGALFKDLGLSEMVVEEGDFKLKMRREVAAGNSDVSVGSGTKPMQKSDDPCTMESAGVGENLQSQAKTETGAEIKSPLLGIFYALSGDKSAVKEGDTVKEGDVLCTIEAMKMMNEVKSTKSGVISKVCAKEGDLVEYNQTLFVVKAS